MGLFAKKREITDNDSIQTPQEVVDLQDRLRECEEDIQEAESRLKTIRAEYNTTITNLINIKKEINEKKEEQKRLSQQNVNLQMQVEQSREILRDSYHDRTVAEKTVADLRQADTDLKAKITEYKAVERRLSDAEKRLAAMQDEIQVINKETEQGRASIERIDADIESKREVLASLKLEQNKVEQKNTKDRHAQDALNTELAHTKMQLAEAITEARRLAFRARRAQETYSRSRKAAD